MNENIKENEPLHKNNKSVKKGGGALVSLS